MATFILNSVNKSNNSQANSLFNVNWDVLEEGEYKVSWSFTNTIPIVVLPFVVTTALTPFQDLLIRKVPWGIYNAANWSGTTLPDTSGNNHHAVTSGVTRSTVSGNGATASITFLSGTTTNTILWPAGSIPTTATIASLTAYSPTGSKQRILTGGSENFIHGHYQGGGGYVYYGDRFLQQVSRVASPNWVGVVSTNSITATSPDNVLVNGTARGTTTGGFGGGDMRINGTAYYNYGETSDFQFSQLIIWDQPLLASEMVTVSAALTTYLATGILQ